METLPDFLKTWGALIIALVALLQPWLRAFWRRFIWKPKLVPHPAGSIEVGFSGFGPTIALIGTLEGRRRQVFIRSMDLELVRAKDKSVHNLSWGIFRSLTLGSTQEGFQLSSGFLVRPEEPYRYNIQFWEGEFQKELRPKLEALRRAWQESVLQAYGDALQAAATGLESAPSQPELRRQIEDHYRGFSQQNLHVTTYQAVQRMCYWEPGDYKIKLQVATAHPDAVHSVTWAFALDEDAVNNLRFNILKILQEVCTQPIGQYNFVYLPYLSSPGEGNA
jgi:hypothetical protein